MTFPATTGLRHMAWAAFWFSIMSLLVKVAGERIPAMQIVFVRALVTLALSGALLARERVSALGRRPAWLLIRGLFGFGGLSCFYAAIVHLPLAEATVVHYTNPVFTALFAAVALGERVGGRLVACLATSLAGVVLIARPRAIFGGGGSVEPLWVGVALAAAVFAALAYVTVRHLGRTEHPLVIVFYFPLVTVPLALPVVALSWVAPSPREWAVLLGVGVTTQIAQVHLTRGLALEPAGRAMSVGYLQIVLAAVWGVAFFGETLDGWSVAGIAAIAASLAWLRRPEFR